MSSLSHSCLFQSQTTGRLSLSKDPIALFYCWNCPSDFPCEIFIMVNAIWTCSMSAPSPATFLLDHHTPAVLASLAVSRQLQMFLCASLSWLLFQTGMLFYKTVLSFISLTTPLRCDFSERLSELRLRRVYCWPSVRHRGQLAFSAILLQVWWPQNPSSYLPNPYYCDYLTLRR